MITATKNLLRILAIGALGASAAACSGGNDDLLAYIDEVKARPGGRIEPLPEVLPYESYAYSMAGERSPFRRAGRARRRADRGRTATGRANTSSSSRSTR